jgi:hypothetical protein
MTESRDRSFNELRIACRHRLDSLEMWLRRIVHEQLSKAYGADYLSATVAEGEHLFSNTTRTQAEKRLRAATPPYARKVA